MSQAVRQEPARRGGARRETVGFPNGAGGRRRESTSGVCAGELSPGAKKARDESRGSPQRVAGRSPAADGSAARHSVTAASFGSRQPERSGRKAGRVKDFGGEADGQAYGLRVNGAARLEGNEGKAVKGAAPLLGAL